MFWVSSWEISEESKKDGWRGRYLETDKGVDRV